MSKVKYKQICIGSGLVALDVVINGNLRIPLKVYAGGSCGNVLAILSFLNWETFPVARLKTNSASKELLSDLINWKVNVDLISLTSDGSTPIIIQRIKKDKNGNSIHRFEFRNPENGKWLPSYKPVLGSEVESITKKSPIPSVYYFDRINRSSIDLAKYYKSNGAVVYFEPSSLGGNKQFEECLNVADIIKFSYDRLKNYTQLYPNQRVPLEIITFGKEGLQYRFSHNLRAKKWKSIPSYKISYVVDAAGSGDWFSAGFISKIAAKGLIGFKNCNENAISKVLKYGQALGALNCFFEGSRGLMYDVDVKCLKVLVKKIQQNNLSTTFITHKEEYKPPKNFRINSLY